MTSLCCYYDSPSLPLYSDYPLSHIMITTLPFVAQQLQDDLGVFSIHLPCEMAEANFRRFQWFSPDSCRFSIDFDGYPVIFNQFQSVSVSFNQF